MLDQLWVVVQSPCLPVDWLAKRLCEAPRIVLVQLSKQAAAQTALPESWRSMRVFVIFWHCFSASDRDAPFAALRADMRPVQKTICKPELVPAPFPFPFVALRLGGPARAPLSPPVFAGEPRRSTS